MSMKRALGLLNFGDASGFVKQISPRAQELKQLADEFRSDVITEKGRGYPYAEKAEDKYHGVAKFYPATGKQFKGRSATQSFTTSFADALIAEAYNDIIAAMCGETGLNLFQKRFPSRCFDVGIAEQHAVTFAARLACEGIKPFCAIYSSFIQRAYDQVVHDVDLQKLPVRFALDRAGHVGADGPTHSGSFDVIFMACLQNMVVMAPSDEAELFHMVATAAAIDDRPSCFRYPRGNGLGVELPPGNKGTPIEIAKGRILKEGERVALLVYGAVVQYCLAAAALVEINGVRVTVADAHFCKPIDHALIRSLAKNHEIVITIEEGSIGGFGSHVAQFMALDGLLDGKTKGVMKQIAAIVDEYARGMISGSGSSLFEELGLYYIDPVDGHNIDDLIAILREVKSTKTTGPVLIHVVTEKGRGYPYAEKAADKYHGMAVGRDLKGKKNNVIAVKGDGAMTAGQAFEAMSNAVYLHSDMIVILNDNKQVSFPTATFDGPSPPVGTLRELREVAKGVIKHIGGPMHQLAAKADDYARGMISGSGLSLFQELGLYYIGPVDGHNIDDLIAILGEVKSTETTGPVLIHVVTEKGRGYPYAEKASDKYHGLAIFDPAIGKQFKGSSATQSSITSCEGIMQRAYDEEERQLMKVLCKSFLNDVLEKEVYNLFVDASCDRFKMKPAVGYVLLDAYLEYVTHGCAPLKLPMDNNTLWEVGAIPEGLACVSTKVKCVRLFSDALNAIRFFEQGDDKLSRVRDFKDYNKYLVEFEELRSEIDVRGLFYNPKATNHAAHNAAHITNSSGREESVEKRMYKAIVSHRLPLWVKPMFWE